MKHKLQNRAKELGIDALEVYTQTKKNIKISVYEQEVSSFLTSHTTGTSVRGIYHGHMGNAYIEEPLEGSDSNIEFVLQKLIDNASIISSDDVNEFYPGGIYADIAIFDPRLEAQSVQEKIILLQRLEASILASDVRIHKVNYCMYQEEQVETTIWNDLGLDVHKKSNVGVVVAGCLASENDDTQSAFEYDIIRSLHDFDAEKLVATLRRDVLAKLNAKKLPSGTYPTILRNDVMASILAALAESFGADLVQKGISIFQNKLGQAIFDSSITLVDDPLLINGYSSTPFDDEGVPTKRHVIVDQGILQTYLHNLKTAKKDGIASTGNGFKASYAGAVNIAPTNFYIEAGIHTVDDMMASVSKGVYITDIAGLHAGLNERTTEFSLQASGFYFENGVVVRPIRLITVAGAFVSMMKEIAMVGQDLKFDSSGVGSPSILFHALQISGD